MIQDNKVKDTLRRGGISVGSWMSLGHESIAEIMAAAGFDWLAIDLEHSVIDIGKLHSLILAIESNGCVPLVRLTSNSPDIAKRVMDAGAYGAIVPMVNSADDALRAVRSIKYPPHGSRGVGLARAHSYGPGFGDYVKIANDQSILIVQIEHMEGVNNIEEILSVEGIDGLIIGPYDLSGSLGLPGELNHPKMEEAKKRILDTAREKNIAAGIHIVYPSIDDLKRCLKEGYRFIAFGADILFLGEFCRASVADIRKLLRET
jgi:2-dehydro-3-deoxyglucarate aldolase